MDILKIPTAEKFVYVNASKIVYFEENKMGFTHLFLESGETITIPVNPEEFLLRLVGSDDKLEEKLLTSSDMRAIFE